MSQLSGTSFANLYGTTGTTFPDNTTGDISEGDMRTFGQDIKDSYLNITDDAYRSFVVTASGTDTYTATLSPAISAYATTQKYFIKFTNANTGAATLNFNSLGAKSIVKNGSTALAAGDIAASQIYCLAYDGTNLQIIGKVSGTGGQELLSTTVAISSSEILALNTTPKTLISAPGAGKYIQVLNGYIYYNRGTTSYSNETTEIEYSTGRDIVGTITSFLNVGVDTLYNFTSPGPTGAFALSEYENASVRYRATSADPTTGDGTISINLIYRIVTL